MNFGLWKVLGVGGDWGTGDLVKSHIDSGKIKKNNIIYNIIKRCIVWRKK